MDVVRKTHWRKTLKIKALIICIILLSIVSASVSYMVGGLLGIFAWFFVFIFIAIEVIYHFGAKGSLHSSFSSKTSSDVPDANVERSIRSARGWYDLDYRGRGRN
jgi:uncharacterized membrane protein